MVSATKTVSIFFCATPIILSTPEKENLACAERQNNKDKSDIIIDYCDVQMIAKNTLDYEKSILKEL